MKKFELFAIAIFALWISMGSAANAESLLYGDSCLGDGTIDTTENLNSQESKALELSLNSSLQAADINYVPNKLICEKIKAHQEELEMVQIALAPAEAVLANPKARNLVITQLITLGLVYTNPAVVAVTVVGVTGFATVYVIMKKTMAQCQALEKEKLKHSLIQELSETYRFQGSPDIELSMP